ncbi:MAG: molybdopterin-guanine dinucleotide biosynthesis protein B [Rhodospirillaceae bacterium]|jgi:molybdopterin-guanine dinucleotide biosynthesis adapter protein|nr:molybdopterin-guanine dinucleotide biosynthesis protein B [Rhodospirillaceae bacterium]MBT5242715.1 molybdopterin-guanine dinucleotide biosynthesis protein B [Rhodospirillaceae bacterium]MBT5561528.1 molybdopterin-guanine dinucleotide biosynthesis protein B [Rhodospirillaceae bacterium]MBT6241874.1 molybdopterin-guanine dinucleotide biosynthesis protein B [Rhodospirillaceae bacterium]MBT7138675.1 molybdopterin-guanine dinucleotide biosynthesis protein B [Rhodospirillaceae bacterium]
MKIFGIVGMSGSGKTELLVKLIPELTARGVGVSTIKHTHHNVEVDKPGKDSYRHRKSGAKQVMVASAGRWSLIRELRDAPEPTLGELIEKLEPVDLLLIEGFKRESHAKLEVFRHDHEQELLAPGDDKIIAVASDGPIEGLSVPLIDLNDVSAVADFILSFNKLEKA